MLNLILEIIVEIIISILLHESLHYLVARKLKLNPQVKMHNLILSITYKNTHEDIKNLFVGAAPLLMVTLIFILPNNKWFVFKVMCFCQIFNILPICADGEVILLSIINLLKKHEKK